MCSNGRVGYGTMLVESQDRDSLPPSPASRQGAFDDNRDAPRFLSDPAVIGVVKVPESRLKSITIIAMLAVALTIAAVVVGATLILQSLTALPTTSISANSPQEQQFQVSSVPHLESQIAFGIRSQENGQTYSENSLFTEYNTGQDPCPSGFTGADCDQCLEGYFGQLCQECSCPAWTICDSGITGSGCICPKGWFGPKCELECPDCGSGQCDDGVDGTGTCICPTGFDPDSQCRECLVGRFGSHCVPCNCHTDNGVCDEGLEGSGQCTCNEHAIGSRCDQCDVGWKGRFCTELDGIELNAFDYCGPNSNNFSETAITFNGFPTDDILLTLKATKIPATFFIQPKKANNVSCRLVQQAVMDKHSIQLGGYDGAEMLQMTADELRAQIFNSLSWLKDCMAPVIERSLCRFTQLRPPNGKLDNGRARFITDLGFNVATWNVDGQSGKDLHWLLQMIEQLKSSSNSVLIKFDVDGFSPVMTITALDNHFLKYGGNFITSPVCYSRCTQQRESGICKYGHSDVKATLPGVFN